MKKGKFSILLLIMMAFSTLIWMSCSRDRIDQEDLNSYESPNQYLDSKKQDEQVFIIDSTGTGPIIGNQGTTIWGSIDCLSLANGDTIDYPFTVKLVELYTPKDIIYYQMPTLSSGVALSTAGEIRLRAEKDGAALYLNQPCAFKISMPNEAPQSNFMNVYYGNENTLPMNWLMDLNFWGITQTQNPFFEVDTIGYTAYIEKLGWINADRQFSNASPHSITFDSDVDDLTNVAIFVYLPNSNTIIQAENLVANAIPEGSDAKVIAIAVNAAGQLFSYYEELNVVSNVTVMISMTSTTDGELTQLLDSL